MKNLKLNLLFCKITEVNTESHNFNRGRFNAGISFITIEKIFLNKGRLICLSKSKYL